MVWKHFEKLSVAALQAYAPMLDLLAVSTVLSALVELGVRLTNLGWFSAFCQSVSVLDLKVVALAESCRMQKLWDEAPKLSPLLL